MTSSAVSGASASAGTVERVSRRFNGRHLDERRRLNPRDYATRPDLFGVADILTFTIPDGGNRASMLVAAEQHRLVCEWTRNGRRPSAQVLAARWGTSIQTISTVCRGERWAGETVLAALSAAVRDRPTTHRHDDGSEPDERQSRPGPR